MDRGVVELRRNGEGGFTASLDPPDPRFPEEHFDDERHARGVAGGIRLVTGRTKVDLTGGGNGEA